MKAFVYQDEHRLEILVPLIPVPASRPRITVRRVRGRATGMAYFDGRYKQFRDDYAHLLSKVKIQRYEGGLEVYTNVYIPRPRTTKKLWPKGDNDNYEKACWDGLNGVAWADDDQIVINRTVKAFTELDPRICIQVRSLEPERMKRTLLWSERLSKRWQDESQ